MCLYAMRLEPGVHNVMLWEWDKSNGVSIVGVRTSAISPNLALQLSLLNFFKLKMLFNINDYKKPWWSMLPIPHQAAGDMVCPNPVGCWGWILGIDQKYTMKQSLTAECSLNSGWLPLYV